ncbi:hypothetical protein [Methanolacinia paynteri]|uniref:hypothetical protein n=1 Tax=Methanolacinia paynteri TaxID=230356 RepID=UPI00064E7A33|nr:hypothetical protein [Methanolacinia paynteri]
MDIQKKSGIIFIILLLCLINIGTASARYATGSGDNAGINVGDVVFIGEKNLDFSLFTNSSGALPVQFVHSDGTRFGVIVLSGGTGSLTGNDITPGVYIPYYTDGSSGSAKCTVAELNLGEIGIYTYNTDFEPQYLPQQPGGIAKTTDIAFAIKSANIDGANLSGNWYKYSLSRDSLTTSTIKNIHQNSVALNDLLIDPRDRPDETLADAPVFDLIAQSIVSSQTGDVPLTAVFSTNNLNGLEKSVSYSFTASSFSPSLSFDSEVSQNAYFDLAITGVPFTSYNITISGSLYGSDAPRFESGEWDDLISDQEISAHTEWTGTKTFQVFVPESAPTNSYEITMTDNEGNTKKQSFIVTSGAMSLVFNEPTEAIESGLFAIGDSILLKGYVTGATKPVDIYLYITGPNLPENGAKLEDFGAEVVDEEESTFTCTKYSLILGEWAYEWNTKDLEPGTYTIYASLKPYGYLSSSYPGGPGTDIKGNVPPSYDFPLSEPTLNIKFDDNNNGYFAKGDIFYGWWLSRGSASELRWYIFGSNFRYADNMSKMSPGITSTGEPYDDDERPLWNEYGFTYNRSFTYNLYPGIYYMVCQHPGPNKAFEVSADSYGSDLRRITTTFGDSVDLSSLQSRNAADALVDLLENPFSDDIYVMTQFIIEDPWIRIDSAGEIVVGDELSISGMTNLAPSGTTPDKTQTKDTLHLSINRLDLDVGSESNTAMKIPVDDATPSDSSDFYRSFRYEGIDTSSWDEGMYQVTVNCKDIDVKKSFAFELVGEKTSSDSENLSPGSDPSFLKSDPSTPSPTRVPSSAITSQQTAVATPSGSQKQSSGPDFALITVSGMLCFLVVVALIRRK